MRTIGANRDHTVRASTARANGSARPLAIDLFCGAGGASFGLWRAGFRVLGIDIAPQPNYQFGFIQADITKLDGYLIETLEPAFIWASPPCQAYSHLTPKEHRGNHAALIDYVRTLCTQNGVHHCIENVAGAKRILRNPLMLCGSMFGLRTRRHRFFETSFPIFKLLPPCDHSRRPLLVTTASKASRALRLAHGEIPKSVTHAKEAYGIDWMNAGELAEAIPPAYSEYIGEAALALLHAERVAA